MIALVLELFAGWLLAAVVTVAALNAVKASVRRRAREVSR